MPPTAKSKKVHYDVVLTKEAREILKDDEVISSLLIDGARFNCIEIDPNRNYFFMKIEKTYKNMGTFITEISIPHYFILYFISADSGKSRSLYSGSQD